MATGSYITTANVQDVFGTQNVISWSNLDRSTTTVDDDRVASAIAWAEAYVESRFRPSEYTVPLSATSGTLSTVLDWMAKLAGYWLYRDRGQDDTDELVERMADVKEQVDQEISLTLAGMRRLNASRAHSSPTAPIAVG